MDTVSGVFAFGRFELDPARAELRRDGEVVRLAPQPFRALEILVAKPGVLVTREELRHALWGQDSFVDFNAGLNFCIAQLRTALDDPATRSAMLVSVPRRGYRFVAEVDVKQPPAPVLAVPVEPAVVAAPAAAASPSSRDSMRRWWLVAAAVSIAAAATQTRTPDPLAIHLPATRNVAALKEFQLATAGLADGAPGDLPSRVARLQSAIDLEPGYAEAHAALAEVHLMRGLYRVVAPPIAYAAAKASAMKALALAPGLADAHAAYAASVLYLEWDWKLAGAHFARADALGHASARRHQLAARYFSASARPADAIGRAREAVRLEPRSVSAKTDLGYALFYAADFEAAFATCTEATEMMAEYLPARWCAAAAAMEAGRFDAPGLPAVRATDARGYWEARAQRLRAAAVTDEQQTERAVSMAVALTHMGRHDEALDWLERGANRRVDTMLYVRAHPAFTPLASHPRFLRVLQRVGP